MRSFYRGFVVAATRDRWRKARVDREPQINRIIFWPQKIRGRLWRKFGRKLPLQKSLKKTLEKYTINKKILKNAFKKIFWRKGWRRFQRMASWKYLLSIFWRIIRGNFGRWLRISPHINGKNDDEERRLHHIFAQDRLSLLKESLFSSLTLWLVRSLVGWDAVLLIEDLDALLWINATYAGCAASGRCELVCAFTPNDRKKIGHTARSTCVYVRKLKISGSSSSKSTILK